MLLKQIKIIKVLAKARLVIIKESGLKPAPIDVNISFEIYLLLEFFFTKSYF